MLQRLREGVPPELAAKAAGTTLEALESDDEAGKAMTEGEIALFERARDSGVTGAVRAAMRHEARTWQPKAEISLGKSLEDLLRD